MTDSTRVPRWSVDTALEHVLALFAAADQR